jgi:hypothetical protein
MNGCAACNSLSLVVYCKIAAAPDQDKLTLSTLEQHTPEIHCCTPLMYSKLHEYQWKKKLTFISPEYEIS